MDALEKARQAKKEMREAGIEIVRLNPREKAKAYPKSLKAAILAKCYECMCDYADGRYDCGMSACPLYRFMPYRDCEPRTKRN